MYLLFWLRNHYIAQLSLELGLYSCPITLSPKKCFFFLFLIENKFLCNIFWSYLYTHNSSQSLFTDPSHPHPLSLFLSLIKNQAGNNKMIDSVTVKTSRKIERKCTGNTCRHRDTHICSCLLSTHCPVIDYNFSDDDWERHWSMSIIIKKKPLKFS